jgi:hypothetical protein
MKSLMTAIVCSLVASSPSWPCRLNLGAICSGRDAVESRRGLFAAEYKAGRRTYPFTQGRNKSDVVELLNGNLKRRGNTLVETGMKNPQDHAKKAECKTRKTMSRARKLNRAKHSQTNVLGRLRAGSTANQIAGSVDQIFHPNINLRSSGLMSNKATQ